MPTTHAIARIRGAAQLPNLHGWITFTQRRHGVWVHASLCGLPETSSGFFALHIHQGKACTGEGFADTLGHYQFAGQLHPQHAGDLPPLLSCNGIAEMCVLTNRITIPQILGRTIVIHEGVDGFQTQPAGNAGSKIACGIIQPWTGTACQRTCHCNQ